MAQGYVGMAGEEERRRLRWEKTIEMTIPAKKKREKGQKEDGWIC